MLIIRIEGSLSTLNEHDNANRNNRFGGAALKKKNTAAVANQFPNPSHRIDYPVKIGFIWYYSGKFDFDNIRFACKYVLDGLVKAGILLNDNQTWVKGFTGDEFIKVKKGEECVDVLIEKV
jgi:Holliday junction resolvase RusA-like endonuclease